MIERFTQMPSALRSNARWERLGPSRVPAMLVHPNWSGTTAVPVVLWMHGRTANKELDPGRYLRWMRAGIGACAVDLPGHGERSMESMQDGSRTLELLQQMVGEVDEIVDSLEALRIFDPDRIAIGGMSAGGMAAMARLCRLHRFRCASVEASSGAWDRHFYNRGDAATRLLRAMNPIAHLDGWQEIPFQAIHSKADQIISFDDQAAFVDAVRKRYRDSSIIDFVQFEQTGAPQEHVGFGRLAAEAKDRQLEFFDKWLQE